MERLDEAGEAEPNSAIRKDKGKRRLDLLPPEFWPLGSLERAIQNWNFNGQGQLSETLLLALGHTSLDEVAKSYEFGLNKYAAYNWVRGMDWSRMIASALRHLYAIRQGEAIDQEQNVSHYAAACFNLASLVHYETHGLGIDDRAVHAKQTKGE